MDRYLAVCATQAPESRIPKCVDVGDTGNTICPINRARQMLSIAEKKSTENFLNRWKSNKCKLVMCNHQSVPVVPVRMKITADPRFTPARDAQNLLLGIYQLIEKLIYTNGYGNFTRGQMLIKHSLYSDKETKDWIFQTI